MKKCLLIDGNNIVFRAYYAFMQQRLTTADGEPTGALFGFLRMLLKTLKDREPDYVAVAFDKSKNTFRKKMYPEYKAKRKPTPEELIFQLPLAQKAVESLGIKVLINENYEADDLIGSVAEQIKADTQVEIISGDRDLLQLISENVTVDLSQKGVSEFRRFDLKEFETEYGFLPKGIIELKALMGDPSDNIPGVKGIGEKKGLELIKKYLTVDELYANIESVDNEKMKQKLIADKDMAYLSRELATIKLDIGCIDDKTSILWSKANLTNENFIQFLKTWQFESLYKEFTTNIENYTTEKTHKELHGERLLIKKLADLDAFFEEGKTSKTICIDLETDGLEPFSNNIIGVALAYNELKAVYVPLAHSYLGIDSSDQIDSEVFFSRLKPALNNKILIGHNLKFDLSFLLAKGINTNNKLFDTLVASYIINHERSNALKSLGSDLLGYNVTEFTSVAKNKNFAEVDIATASFYACQDVLLTLKLYSIFTKELKERNLLTLFENIEMPVLKILMEMERTGTKLNTDYLKQFLKEITTTLISLEESIHELAGMPFNIASTKQLQTVLFEVLELTPPKKTKTGFSTDSEVLQMLANDHQICSQLLQYRELSKLKSTYTTSLINLISPISGLLHTSFNQAVTATGRLSSSNPNMQNIPIKTEWGKKIRRAFEPPRSEDLFLSIDYSQIELRFLAHFSLDPFLIEAYKTNLDIHTLTAAKIFKCDKSEVSKQMRNVGKTVNFGMLYGISAHSLAIDLGITRPQAKEYIDSFYESFAQVSTFFDSILAEARQRQFVTTILGRNRQINSINSKNFHLRSAAERIARNTVLQGSAADIVKKAMIDTDRLINQQGFKTKLILQIHDELVFSVPRDELPIISELLINTMENTVKLNVPLVCDANAGKNLADLTDYKEYC